MGRERKRPRKIKGNRGKIIKQRERGEEGCNQEKRKMKNVIRGKRTRKERGEG